MIRPLIHGCYDSKTLETLKANKIQEFSFDLRARSLNLVTFTELNAVLKKFTNEKVFLTFENDRAETIHSYFDLLKDSPVKLIPLFRDRQSPDYYRSIGRSFYWMFDPAADWKSMLMVDSLVGLFLPLNHQLFFDGYSEFWELVGYRNLDIYLHADSFEQALWLNPGDEVKLSIDLSKEVEEGFRKIDQQKFQSMKIWSKYHETSSL